MVVVVDDAVVRELDDIASGGTVTRAVDNDVVVVRGTDVSAAVGVADPLVGVAQASSAPRTPRPTSCSSARRFTR